MMPDLVRRWAMAPGIYDPQALGLEGMRRAVGQRIAWGQELLAAGDCERFLLHACAADRLWVFEQLSPMMTDDTYWRLAHTTYTECAMGLWQHPALVRAMLTARRPCREHFMREEERIAFAALPDVLTVYRGFQPSNAAGWSWSLRAEIAEFYALTRWDDGFRTSYQRGYVARGAVARRDVVGYLVSQCQDEIVCDPMLVGVTSIDALAYPAPFEAMSDETLARLARDEPDAHPLVRTGCNQEIARRRRETAQARD